MHLTICHRHLGILSLLVSFLLTAMCGGQECAAQLPKAVRGHVTMQGTRPQFRCLRDGFSSTTVNSVLQDAEGFIWVATANGLSRYDGHKVWNFDIDSLRGNVAAGCKIMAMADDTLSQCIWASLETSQRLVRIDKRNFEATVLDYSIPADESMQTSEYVKVVISMMSLDDSTLLCRNTKGFYAINKNTGHVSLIKRYYGGMNSARTPFFRLAGSIYNVGGGVIFRIEPQSAGRCSIEQVDIMGRRNIKDAVALDDTTLVFITMERIRKFGIHLYHLPSKEVETLGYSEASPHGVAVADDGVWVPTNHGLFFLSFKDRKQTVYNTVNTNIQDNDLSCILKVRDQHVFFIGSADGLVYLSYFDGKFMHTDMRRFSTSENPQVWSVAKDSRQISWVGCIDGLYVQRPNTAYFDSVPIANAQHGPKGSFMVLSIDETLECDAMIVSTNKDVFRVSTDGKSVHRLFHDNDMIRCSQPLEGHEVVVTCRSKISVISAKDGHEIRSLLPPKGRMFNVSHTDDGKMLWVSVGKSEVQGIELSTLGVKYVINLAEDSVKGGVRDFRHNTRNGLNELWIATSDGLLYKNPGYPGGRLINDGDCLKSQIRSIEIDLNGVLWASTDLGIVSVNGDKVVEFPSKVYQLVDRFINRSSNRGSNGEILMGGKCGVTEFSPLLFSSNCFFPTPKVTSYTYMNSISEGFDSMAGREFIYGSGDIVIPPSIRGLRLDVRSLNYDRLDVTGVEWRFNTDKVWKLCPADGSVMISGLNEGTYDLYFRSIDDDGNPQAGFSTLRLVNHVYFYQKRIFIAIIIIAVIAIVFALFVWRSSLHLQIKRKLEREMSTMGDMLVMANKQLRDNQQLIKQKNEELAQINEELENKVEERTRDLKAAKAKAEESSELKSAFLASLGHEVRTPMNAIVGFAKLINDENCPADEQREFASLILASSNSLLSIMGALLDTSRIERGKIEAVLSDVLIYKWIVETHNILSVEKRSRDVDYVLDIADNLRDAVLVTDKDRLRQVIINLTYNAFKFTERGHVKMTVWRGDDAEVMRLGCEASSQPSSDDVLIFSIEDTGIGIPQGQTEVIFEPFRRLDASKGKYGGMGLGLNIVKGFVNLLGGDVWVKSALGVGSVFFFYIPFGLEKQTVVGSLKSCTPPKNETNI